MSGHSHQPSFRMIFVKVLISLVSFAVLCEAFPSSNLDVSKIMTLPDKNSGKALTEWMKLKVGNPEEQGNYFEGDIILNLDKRNGITLPTLRWEKGIIPYKIGAGFCEFSVACLSWLKNNLIFIISQQAKKRDKRRNRPAAEKHLP
jgi:hypothetical protein